MLIHWMLIRKKRWNRLIRNIIFIRSVMSMKLFANWRRTGYPKLTPSRNAASYPNNVTNGEIPRRFIYPASEING